MAVGADGKVSEPGLRRDDAAGAFFRTFDEAG